MVSHLTIILNRSLLESNIVIQRPNDVFKHVSVTYIRAETT
jgi:hypothetical protein